MTLFLIVNPVAGRGRGQALWPQIEQQLLEHGLQYTVAFTAFPGHARELAKKAVDAGNQVVVAVGGDGTLTEVVNGLGHSDATVGLIPVGSGNDFARSLRIPSDNLAEVVQVLAAGETITVDLGQVDDDLFINVAGVGFDAQVTLTMAEKAKWLRGTTAYAYSVVRSLLTFKPVPIHLILDGNHYHTEAMFVAVANGRFFGGGMCVAPTAELDDGYFDVVVLERLGVLAFLRAFPRVYRGTHLTHPQVKLYRARRVQVNPESADYKVPAQAEGNFIGQAPKEFTVIPAARRVIVPETVAAQHGRRKELAIGSLA